MEAPRTERTTPATYIPQAVVFNDPVSLLAESTLASTSSIEPIDSRLDDHVYRSAVPTMNNRQAVVIENRFDEHYLNEADKTFDEIAGKISDCLYTELVAPKVEALQTYTATLPQLLNSTASFVLGLGNLAEKNSGLLLQDNMVNRPPSNNFIFLLNWMTSNDFILKEAQDNYKTKLLNQVAKDLESKLKDYERDFLNPSLQWIFSAEHSTSFKDHFNLSTADELVIVKNVCYVAMKALINQKVEVYCEHITDVVNNRLGDLIKHNMRDHAIRKLVNFKSEHLLKVIQGINWKNLIDYSVTLFLNTLMPI